MRSNRLSSRSNNTTTAYSDTGSYAGSNPSSMPQSRYASSLAEHLPSRSATSTSSTRRASRQSIDSTGSRSNYGGVPPSAGSQGWVSSLADMGGAASGMGSVGPGPSRFAHSTMYTPSEQTSTPASQDQFYFQGASFAASSQSAATLDAYSQLQAPSVPYGGFAHSQHGSSSSFSFGVPDNPAAASQAFDMQPHWSALSDATPSHMGLESRSSSSLNDSRLSTRHRGMRSSSSSSKQRSLYAGIDEALSHPGVSVRFELQHARPSDARTEDERSSSDAHMTITYGRDGDQRSLEIESSRFGAPSHQALSTHSSKKSLARAAREALVPLMQGLDLTGRSYAESVTQATRSSLPGPLAGSRLSSEQVALVGVARWPDARFNEESSESNQSYGRRFHTTAQEAASRISSGSITSFRELWDYAGSARASWGQGSAAGPTVAPSNASSVGTFEISYPRDTMAGTPMRGRYFYMANRLKDLDLPEQANSTLGSSAESSRSSSFMSHRVLQSREWLGDQVVDLTKLKIPAKGHSDDFKSSEAERMRQEGWPDGYPFMIEHTNSHLIQPIMNHVEDLVEPLLKSQMDESTLVSSLGEVHWWMAHAMPDERGSAAKTEIAVRALAGAHGVELPPFRRGVVPDLEAFMTDRESFRDNYSSMFEEASFDERR